MFESLRQELHFQHGKVGALSTHRAENEGLILEVWSQLPVA